MNNNITPSMTLSITEARKCLRDTVLIAVSTVIPEIIQTLQLVDFGEYQTIVTLLLSIATVFVNRYLNILRV